jgi:hypothetical protein
MFQPSRLESDCETKKVDPKTSSKALQLLFDPDLAMIVMASGHPIVSEPETPSNNPVHDMDNGNHIRRKDFYTGQSCQRSSPKISFMSAAPYLWITLLPHIVIKRHKKAVSPLTID